jgi:RNA polymerase sigma factor (sigma-70 family)
MSTSGDIDWSLVDDLGKDYDKAIAERLGVTVRDVFSARKKLGIAPYSPGRKRRPPSKHKRIEAEETQTASEPARRGRKPTKINWDDIPLGELPDDVLAEAFDLAYSTVRSARQARGIPKANRKNSYIIWDDVPWGTASDGELAKRLGISSGMVGAYRRALGIPAFRGAHCAKGASREPIKWDRQPLGRTSDLSIARNLGITASEVTLARSLRGIKPFRASEDYRINWDEQPLGKSTDRELSEKLDIPVAIIAWQRKKRGIPSPLTKRERYLLASKHHRESRYRTYSRITNPQRITDAYCEEMGIVLKDVTRFAGVSASLVSGLRSERLAAMGPYRWKESAWSIADFFGVGPSQIWTQWDALGHVDVDTNGLDEIESGWPSPDEAAHFKSLRELFEATFEVVLTKREQEVINLRFSDDAPTLEDIGEVYEVSRERIRQIESLAIEKLRYAFGLTPPPPATTAKTETSSAKAKGPKKSRNRKTRARKGRPRFVPTLIAYLDADPDRMFTLHQIIGYMEAHDFAENTVRSTLPRLVKRGEILRPKHSHYQSAKGP